MLLEAGNLSGRRETREKHQPHRKIHSLNPVLHHESSLCAFRSSIPSFARCLRDRSLTHSLVIVRYLTDSRATLPPHLTRDINVHTYPVPRFFGLSTGRDQERARFIDIDIDIVEQQQQQQWCTKRTMSSGGSAASSSSSRSSSRCG